MKRIPQDIKDIIVNMVFGMRHREKFKATVDRIALINRNQYRSDDGNAGMLFITSWEPCTCPCPPTEYWSWRYTWFEHRGKSVISGKAGIIGFNYG